MTQRDTDATILWLRNDRHSGSRSWKGKCQMRVRMGRNLPAVFPSAFAAMVGTPMSDRVFDLDKITRGMQGFADDPNDSNAFGHTFTFVGRSPSGTLLVDTNDALIVGGGSVVAYDWFGPHWGDPFKFAATSCNGFDLDLPEGPKPKHPHPKHPPKDREPSTENFDYAEHRLEKALVWHQQHDFPALARRIRKEMDDLKEVRRLSAERRKQRRDT